MSSITASRAGKNLVITPGAWAWTLQAGRARTAARAQVPANMARVRRHSRAEVIMPITQAMMVDMAIMEMTTTMVTTSTMTSSMTMKMAITTTSTTTSMVVVVMLMQEPAMVVMAMAPTVMPQASMDPMFITATTIKEHMVTTTTTMTTIAVSMPMASTTTATATTMTMASATAIVTMAMTTTTNMTMTMTMTILPHLPVAVVVLAAVMGNITVVPCH